MPEETTTINAPQTPPTLPGVAEGQQFGTTQAGETITAESPEVQAEMERVPGVTEEAAIGTVAMREPKAITTTASIREQRDADQGRLTGELTAIEQRRQEQEFLTTEEAARRKAEPEVALDPLDIEFDKYDKAYEEMKTGMDESTKAMIDSIKENYAARRDAMKVTNQSRLKGLEILGTRTGRQRYAAEIQEGILSAEETAGMKRISELDREEKMLIMQAEQANDAKQWDMLNQRMGQLAAVREEKRTELQMQWNRAAQLEQQAMEKIKVAREDQKFLLDVEKFNLDIDKHNIDSAVKIANQNGYQVGFDVDGNPTIIPELTAENQLKLDRFDFDIEKFGWDKTMDMFDNEIKEKNLNLDINKFNENVRQFGLEYALDEANHTLQRDKYYIDRFDKGVPTSYDQLGMLAPSSDVESVVGSLLATKYNQGEKGGQCGDFAHNLVDFPPIGDSLESKLQSINKYGVDANIWRENLPAVGDVIITNASDVSASGQATQYGHVAIVAAVNDDGTVSLVESNANGDERVGVGRTLSINSPAIQGAIRGDINTNIMNQAENIAAQNVMDSIENRGKPPTSSQYMVAGYASRMAQSEEIFDELEGYVKNLSTAKLIKYQVESYPNWRKPEEYQRLEQAQRNFVNATLRRESGAAISPEEFKSAEKQYFPMPGDTDAVLSQKKRNRDLVIDNFAREAGEAYEYEGYDPYDMGEEDNLNTYTQ